MSNHAMLPIAEGVGGDVASFDSGDGVFVPPPHMANHLIDGLEGVGNFPALRIFPSCQMAVPSGLSPLKTGVLDQHHFGWKDMTRLPPLMSRLFWRCAFFCRSYPPLVLS